MGAGVEAARRIDGPLSGLFKARIAVPPEKGAWVWLLGPMVVGLAAASDFSLDGLTVLVGAFAAYLLRQPATLAIKSRRRARSAADLPAIWTWCVVYGLIALGSAAWLLYRGHTWVVALGLAGGAFFARHLWLVSRGDERHRVGMDIGAAGMLALSAPAMILVHDPRALISAAVLWAVLWMQASASVIHMFLRLEQRRWPAMPPLRERVRRGLEPVAYHAANLVLAVALVAADLAPAIIVAGFALALAEGVAGVAKPPVGHTPRQLGMRQLAVSSAFMALITAGYLFQ